MRVAFQLIKLSYLNGYHVKKFKLQAVWWEKMAWHRPFQTFHNTATKGTVTGSHLHMSLSECLPWFGGQHGLILGFCKTVQKRAKLFISMVTRVHGSRIIPKIRVHQCLMNFGYKQALYKTKNIVECCTSNLKMAYQCHRNCWICECVSLAGLLIQGLVWY